MGLSLQVGDVQAVDGHALPAAILEASAAYKTNGADAFFPSLVRNASVPQPYLDRARNTLKAVEAIYGNYLGTQLIGSVAISSLTRVVYFELDYERGPVYGKAYFYTTSGGETVTDFAINIALKEIIPSELVTKLR
jgi:hypothetical protein